MIPKVGATIPKEVLVLFREKEVVTLRATAAKYLNIYSLKRGKFPMEQYFHYLLCNDHAWIYIILI